MLSAFGPTSLENVLSSLGAHSRTKPMYLRTTGLFWLVRSLRHRELSLITIFTDIQMIFEYLIN